MMRRKLVPTAGSNLSAGGKCCLTQSKEIIACPLPKTFTYLSQAAEIIFLDRWSCCWDVEGGGEACVWESLLSFRPLQQIRWPLLRHLIESLWPKEADTPPTISNVLLKSQLQDKSMWAYIWSWCLLRIQSFNQCHLLREPNICSISIIAEIYLSNIY